MKRSILLIAITSLFFCSTKKEITWVALGDSITYLNDHKDETGNRVSRGYMTRVTDELPNIQYVNQGHNGWTAIRIATEIENLGLEKADLYSVFLGTNDWWGSKPLGSFADYQNGTGTGTVYGSFRIIINKFRSLNPAARIILVTPMQRVDFVYISNYKNNAFGSYKEKAGQTLQQFAEAINMIGRYEKLTVIDLYNKSGMTHANLVKFKRLKDPVTGAYRDYRYPSFIDVPFDPEKDDYPYPLEAMDMTYDGLHPSDKGYAVIADMFIKALKQ